MFCFNYPRLNSSSQQAVFASTPLCFDQERVFLGFETRVIVRSIAAVAGDNSRSPKEALATEIEVHIPHRTVVFAGVLAQVDAFRTVMFVAWHRFRLSLFGRDAMILLQLRVSKPQVSTLLRER